MWRVISASNLKSVETTSASLLFVRWRRKPRWLPVAKSKLFRVPERKQQNPDERAELMRLHNNYKTQMRSLRQFFREEVTTAEKVSTADHIVLTPEQEEEEFQKCIEINNLWNESIAAKRAERLDKERQDIKVYVEERLRLARIQAEEERNQIEEIVRFEKERFKTAITFANLDEAIERSLNNPTDYNFAIDLHGNMYKGRKNCGANKEDEAKIISMTAQASN